MAETLLATMATNAALPAAGASVATAAQVGATTAGSILNSSLFAALPSAGTALSLIGSLGGAASQAASGNYAAAAYRQQAEQASVNAKVEKLNAQERAQEIRRELLSNISSANAAFASRGLSIETGTPAQARSASAANAQDAIDKVRFGGGLRERERLLEASRNRQDATAARISGYGKAAGSLFSARRSINSLVDF